MELEVLKYIAAAIAFLPAIGAALALGSIFSSYNEAVGCNQLQRLNLTVSSSWLLVLLKRLRFSALLWHLPSSSYRPIV